MAEKRKSEDQQQQNGSASKVLKSDDFHTSQEFKQALLSHPVEYLAYRKKDGIVFFVDRSDKVSDVFKGLIKHNFLSVPVLQKHKHKWYGFVEVGDIVQFYVENFGDKLGDEGKATWDAIAQNEGFGEKTVNDVMKYPLTRKNPFHPITLGYSLFYAFETLAKEEELHRVPIIDRDRNLKSVLTLSQVVEYVHDNLETLGTIKNKPIKDIPGAIKPVVFINHKAKAIEGFKLMQQKNVGGLAVVDEEGKIVGHLSQRDLKGIRLDNQLFQRLFQETHNFIRHLRSEFKDSHPKTKQVLHETETLGDAVKLLVEHNIHRAFVVDKDHKPIGVVALKDILLEIITH